MSEIERLRRVEEVARQVYMDSVAITLVLATHNAAPALVETMREWNRAFSRVLPHPSGEMADMILAAGRAHD